MSTQTQTNYTPVIEAATLAATSEYQGAQKLATFLGTSPSYDTWETVRIQWIKAYAEKRAILAKECTPEAAAKAWERAAQSMEAFFGLEKPKSTKKAAAAKAASRETAKAHVLKVVKQHAPAKLSPLEVSEKAARMLAEAKAGNVPDEVKSRVIAEARILTDEAIRRQKEADKAAKAKAQAATKEQRQALTKIVAGLEGEELLALAYAASHKAELAKWYKAQLGELAEKLKAA